VTAALVGRSDDLSEATSRDRIGAGIWFELIEPDARRWRTGRSRLVADAGVDSDWRVHVAQRRLI